MKFNRALEERIEIVSSGAIENRVKAFMVNGKGPFSIYDLSKSTNREHTQAYKTLINQKVRNKISKHIKELEANDTRYTDISFRASGEVVITADDGTIIAQGYVD